MYKLITRITIKGEFGRYQVVCVMTDWNKNLPCFARDQCDQIWQFIEL